MPVSLDLVNVTIEGLLQRPWPFDGDGEDWTYVYKMAFSQLGRSQKLLCILPRQDTSSHWHLVSYATLYRVVTRISTQLEEHQAGLDISTSRGEYMLENLLDLRWWTWVIALRVDDDLKLDYTVYFGALNEGVSEAKVLSPWRRSDSVVRSLPSYGFELWQQKAWECWKKKFQFSNQMLDGEDLDMLLAEIRNAKLRVFEIKLSAPIRHAQKPSLMQDDLEIDPTQDFLGASSEGYVIRTTCLGEACALKRIDTLDGNPPDLARLSHPHVVHLKHHWSEKSGPHDEARGLIPKPTFMTFLVMEVMHGDLAKLMRTKKAGVAPFSLPVSVDLMLQIAKGMLYVHEMGVSHPHLRCENILCRIENNITETLRVGDVLVKVGGFGRCSRTANANSKNRDILCFGLTCLEILTGDESWSEAIHGVDNGSRPAVPETAPPVLKYCIESCLDPELTASKLAFPEVVMLLLLAQLQILQTRKDGPMMLSSTASLRVESMHPENQDPASLSRLDCGLDEVFHVHQLHPQPREDVSTSSQMTLVFFHGFPKVSEEWRMTWMTRDNQLLWPEKWLPEDVCEDIQVLSVSYDDHLDVSSDQYLLEISTNVLQSLVLSTQWNLGETNQVITLVGHSFGGVIIKALVSEAQKESRKSVRPDSKAFVRVMKCRRFLKNLASVVFFSVPHALTSTEFENYISGCSSTRVLQRSSLLKSLRRNKDRFVRDMIQLSADFESAVTPKMKVLAFLEGKPMSKKTFLVAGNSCEEPSVSWERHTVPKDNHFEVCRPDSKDHAAYKILLQHLIEEQLDNQKNNRRGVILRVDPNSKESTEAVGEKLDRRKKRVELTNQIFNLVGYFSVLQGVILTAVSQLTQSGQHCGKVWFPSVLSGLAAVALVTGIGLKYKHLDNLIHEERLEQKEAEQREAAFQGKGAEFRFSGVGDARRREQESYWPLKAVSAIGVVLAFALLAILSNFEIMCDKLVTKGFALSSFARWYESK